MGTGVPWRAEEGLECPGRLTQDWGHLSNILSPRSFSTQPALSLTEQAGALDQVTSILCLSSLILRDDSCTFHATFNQRQRRSAQGPAHHRFSGPLGNLSRPTVHVPTLSSHSCLQNDPYASSRRCHTLAVFSLAQTRQPEAQGCPIQQPRQHQVHGPVSPPLPYCATHRW